MNRIEFIGKCLLIDKKILVIGDLHLGYEGSMRESGYMIPSGLYKQTIEDLDLIFERVGEVDKVILLGDVKHEFGKIQRDEWREIGEILNYLRMKAKKVIIVKGNHDVIINSVIKDLDRVDLIDYCIIGNTAFLHGDKDFSKVNEKGIKMWVIAHGHPAITLYEEKGSKKEKYKCFLEGKYKGKKIIIIPSFFGVNEGTDVLGGFDLGIAWKFNLKKFKIKIIDENSLKVLDFGKLGSF